MISLSMLMARQAPGYVVGIGLLFQTSVLFIGLIMFLFLQRLLTDAPLVPADVLVVFIMGLICFIPFAPFVRGMFRSSFETGDVVNSSLLATMFDRGT